MDLVSQDSDNKTREKTQTRKEIKQEPMQKIQTRNEEDYRKDKHKNTNFGATTQKNKNCGSGGDQNWTPLHKCLDKTVECNDFHKVVHFSKYDAAKPKTQKDKE